MVKAKISSWGLRKQKPKKIKATPLDEILKLANQSPTSSKLVNKIIEMDTPYFIITLCLICFTVLYLITVAPELVQKLLTGGAGLGWLGYSLFGLLRRNKIRKNIKL
jgi:hypothetical protein